MVKSRAIQPARKRRAFRFALPFLIASGLAFLLGFIVFAEHISDMHQPPSVAEADGIIVLTGGQSRMEAAYSLLAAGKGKRLLISGVHPAIGEKSLMQAVGADPAKFACCIDIDRRAQETVGNAVESVKWAQSLGFKRVILVTNNYHMPRSLLEFRRARPKLEIVPYPVVNSDLGNGSWMVRPDTIRVLFAEYLKYLGALSRAVLPVPASISSMTGTPKPS
jgi:uncharacterized SAM-binding protein YcdF (DUF218 family)